jgi:hypothetical protein
MLSRGYHEICKLLGAPLHIGKVEHTLSQPPEESRHAVLEHFAAR